MSKGRKYIYALSIPVQTPDNLGQLGCVILKRNKINDELFFGFGYDKKSKFSQQSFYESELENITDQALVKSLVKIGVDEVERTFQE